MRSASPQAVRDYLRLLLSARPYEVFVGLFLDSQNRLLAAEELFRGTLAQTSPSTRAKWSRPRSRAMPRR